jgi:hypothetical protein
MGLDVSPSNLHEDGADVDDSEAFGAAPSDAERGAAPSDAGLERAIALVPGVAAAYVRRSAASGSSRLRIRLAAGEDPRKVSWAVAATLRERFSIVLNPDDIRPREAATPTSVDVVSPSGSGANGRPARPSGDEAGSEQEREPVAGPGEQHQPERASGAGSRHEPDDEPGEGPPIGPITMTTTARDPIAISRPPATAAGADEDDADTERGDSHTARHASVDPGAVAGDADEVTDVAADQVGAEVPASKAEPASASRPRVGPPWPVPTDRSSRWVRREAPPFTTVSGEATPRPQPRQAAEPPAESTTPTSTVAPSSPAAQATSAPPEDRRLRKEHRSRPEDHTPSQRPTPSTGHAGQERSAAAEPRIVRSVVSRPARAAIRHLDTHRDERDVRVTPPPPRGRPGGRGGGGGGAGGY